MGDQMDFLVWTKANVLDVDTKRVVKGDAEDDQTFMCEILKDSLLATWSSFAISGRPYGSVENTVRHDGSVARERRPDEHSRQQEPMSIGSRTEPLFPTALILAEQLTILLRKRGIVYFVEEDVPQIDALSSCDILISVRVDQYSGATAPGDVSRPAWHDGWSLSSEPHRYRGRAVGSGRNGRASVSK
jgi:hypothetical protein